MSRRCGFCDVASPSFYQEEVYGVMGLSLSLSLTLSSHLCLPIPDSGSGPDGTRERKPTVRLPEHVLRLESQTFARKDENFN